MLFFRKRSSLPRASIAFFWASIVSRVLDMAGASMMSGHEASTPAEWASVVRRLRPATGNIAAPPMLAPEPGEPIADGA